MQNAVAALGEQGRGPHADIWGALSLDAQGGRVILYATDPQRAAAMVEAAHKAHPDTGGVEVKIVQCQHTAKDENAAVDRILAAQKAKPFLYDTYGLGPTMDGTGVRVYASAEALKSADFAKQLQDAAGAIPVKLVLGSKGTPAVAVATPRPSSS